MITARTQDLTISLPQWQYQQLQQQAAQAGVQPVDIILGLLNDYLAAQEFQENKSDLENELEVDSEANLSFLFQKIDRNSLLNPTPEQLKDEAEAYRTFMMVMSKSEHMQSLSDEDIDRMCKEARQIIYEENYPKEETLPELSPVAY